MVELVATLAAATGATAYPGGGGYVIAGYLVTILALAGYIAHLLYRARRARFGTAAVAARASGRERGGDR